MRFDQASISALPAVLALLALPAVAGAQGRPAGVVTTVQGSATLARVALAEPRDLRLRDDVFLHDRIATGERALARILLGGKALVTVRERSTLTISERPGASTIEMSAGRLAVAAVKSRMRGETIEIRTPNAVAAIRGTVVVVEVSEAPNPAGPGTSFVTSVTVLRGLVDVTALDATGRPVGPAVSLPALHLGVVSGATPPQARQVTPEAATELSETFKPRVPAAVVDPPVPQNVLSTQIRAAADHAASLTKENVGNLTRADAPSQHDAASGKPGPILGVQPVAGGLAANPSGIATVPQVGASSGQTSGGLRGATTSDAVRGFEVVTVDAAGNVVNGAVSSAGSTVSGATRILRIRPR